MIEELTYSYATTISERIQCWQGLKLESDVYFKQWQARKSLLKAADYTKMLQCYELDEKTFGIGLLPFTEERAQLLLPTVEKSEWFQLHRTLFRTEVSIKEESLSAALRFHIDYYERHIRNLSKKFSKIRLSEKAIVKLIEQLTDEFLFIAQKTLVWDVHQMIEEYHLQAETKEEEFTKYIDEFLGDKQRTYLFYGEYPALARVLATRLRFACEMIDEFMSAVNDSTEQISKRFALSSLMDITKIEVGKGDSHDRGKTVIQFQIQEKSLIFKFKNLEIGERFNALLTYLEGLNPALSYYKIKRIVQPTFTIEERVAHQECKDEEDVTKFYQEYGQLLAIVYWLGSTDLHMENVIASGAHPVLIDVETLIRPEMFKQTQKTSRQIRIEKQSVLVTGLVPQKKQWKRVLEMDALSGTEQKLPKKVRRLRNERSSEIAFQLEEAYMDGAQNIPYLAGKEVDYQLYRHVIQSSFKKMNQLLLNNKVAFIEKVKKLFSNTAIRLIYRDTQDYGNLLNFTLHTESMSNYIEREKIIGNLWASQIIPEALIPFEIQAMLDHDIPLITANTSLTSVYTNGYELPNLLAKTPLQDTVEHMEKITEKTSHFSYLLLKESLGTLEYKLQEITIAEKNSSMDQPLLQKAADIGDKIIDQIDINYDLGEVDWMSVLPESATEIGIGYPDTDLYGGSAGVYLFLVYLNYYVPKKSYQEIIALLEKDIFLIKEDINTYESAFFADGMRVTVAFYVTKLLKDAKHRSYMETSLRSLKESRTTSVTVANEWLYGKASLIAILATVSQAFHNKDAYELLSRYTQEITLEEMEDNSFAHGYAGICYGLNSAKQVLQSSTVEEKLKWYQQRFEKQLYKEDSLNVSWCRGITGIEEVCHVLNRSFPNKNIMGIEDKSREEACLCHGRYGNNDNYLNNILKLSESVIKLKSDIENTPIGLFCGLAGIGYQLLRAYDPVNVHSLLFIK